MTIRDWIELAVLGVITITSIGRWIEAREQREKRNNDDIGATRGDLAEFEKRHQEEHEKLWREIERNRDHWHKDLVPQLQSVFSRLAVVEETQHAIRNDLQRLQTICDRRHWTRE